MSWNTSERRSNGVQVVDLHGLGHFEAEDVVEKFITDNFNALPVKIVTGDSSKMKNIVFNCAKRYDLFCQKEFWTNNGCFMITDQEI